MHRSAANCSRVLVFVEQIFVTCSGTWTGCLGHILPIEWMDETWMTDRHCGAKLWLVMRRGCISRMDNSHRPPNEETLWSRSFCLDLVLVYMSHDANNSTPSLHWACLDFVITLKVHAKCFRGECGTGNQWRTIEHRIGTHINFSLRPARLCPASKLIHLIMALSACHYATNSTLAIVVIGLG